MTKMGMVLAVVVLLGSTAVFVSAKGTDTEAAPCASVVVRDESTGENRGKDGKCATVFFEEGIYTVYLSEEKEEIIRAMEDISGVRRVTWR